MLFLPEILDFATYGRALGMPEDESSTCIFLFLQSTTSKDMTQDMSIFQQHLLSNVYNEKRTNLNAKQIQLFTQHPMIPLLRLLHPLLV